MQENEQYEIWDEFLKVWPLERVKNMTLEEYTKVGSKDTFTSWIESKLDSIGSIWGGSSFKFGVYSRKDTKYVESTGMRSYNDEYGWYTYCGDTPEEAFQKVKQDIVSVIESVKSGNLIMIDENDLGEAFKWKIAFHYQDRNNPSIVNVFLRKALLVYLGEEKRSTPMSELYKRVMQERDSTDLIEFAEQVWTIWEEIKPMRFWKISHGSDAQSGEFREELLANNLIAVHKDTGKSQAANFENELQIGDYFYLCHAGSIQLLGKVESDVETCDFLDDNWMCRKYSIIKRVEVSKQYNGIKKGWSPNYNSTCKMVPKTELKLFEKNILLPFFDMDLTIFSGEQVQDEEVNSVESSDEAVKKVIELPLNQILYGPPGTGKTHLLTEYKSLFTEVIHAIDDESWMDQTIGQLAWWEVVAAVMVELNKPSIVVEIFEHPYISSKCRVLNKTKNIKQQIWAALQTHTSLESKTVNYKTRNEPFIFDKEEKSHWVLLDGGEDDCSEVLEAMDKFKKDKPTELSIERYQFITFHQSYGYEEFVEGIRAIVDDDDPSAQVRYEVKPGIFLDMCDKARKDSSNQYALFIDEINRGNISKIFGELITLIEDDKRDNGKEDNNKITVVLPYSKEPFTVPENLHIIGTMNTADRSIAHMDTALRRRFEFKEIMSEPNLLIDIDMSDEGIDIARMLYTLNKRIEFLYDREHTIGHAFFWPLFGTPTLPALKNIFELKIIPLLQEYFFDDYEKIRIVLGDNQKDNEYQFIQKQHIAVDEWFGNAKLGYSDPVEYIINNKAFLEVDSYIGIYESAPYVDWN